MRRLRLAVCVVVSAGNIVRRFTTGSPNDETPWLPNKEMTKPCEVSDETSTNLFPHFQCLTLQCDPSTLKPRHGVVSDFGPRLGVDLGGQLRTLDQGGCFPGNDTGFPGLASDPTRPDPTSTSEPNFHILSPDPTPSDPTPYWRVATRRVGRFSYLPVWRYMSVIMKRQIVVGYQRYGSHLVYVLT